MAPSSIVTWVIHDTFFLLSHHSTSPDYPDFQISPKSTQYFLLLSQNPLSLSITASYQAHSICSFCPHSEPYLFSRGQVLFLKDKCNPIIHLFTALQCLPTALKEKQGPGTVVHRLGTVAHSCNASTLGGQGGQIT